MCKKCGFDEKSVVVRNPIVFIRKENGEYVGAVHNEEHPQRITAEVLDDMKDEERYALSLLIVSDALDDATLLSADLMQEDDKFSDFIIQAIDAWKIQATERIARNKIRKILDAILGEIPVEKAAEHFGEKVN